MATYPRDLERDAALCENAGANLIFHPEPENMYESDFAVSLTWMDLRRDCAVKQDRHISVVSAQ